MSDLIGLGGEGGLRDVPFWMALAVCEKISETVREKGWLVKDAS